MNIVSCFPLVPGSVDKKLTPNRKHIDACRGNVWAQLRLANPQWVVLVGGIALEAMAPWAVWGSKVRKITEMRGQVWTWEGMHWTPIVHPAAALRDGKYKLLFEKDIARLVTMLKSGPDYGEECLMCGLPVYEYDYTGVPFCKSHQRNIEFGGAKGAHESKADG